MEPRRSASRLISHCPSVAIITMQSATNVPATASKVTKYTRAGHAGRDITCPHCNSISTVYHFAWHSLVCEHCSVAVEKTEFFTASNY
jgi:ribosomal protein S27E